MAIKEKRIKKDFCFPAGDWVVFNKTLGEVSPLYLPKTLKEWVEFNKVQGMFSLWDLDKDDIAIVTRGLYNEKYSTGMRPEKEDLIIPRTENDEIARLGGKYAIVKQGNIRAVFELEEDAKLALKVLIKKKK